MRWFEFLDSMKCQVGLDSATSRKLDLRVCAGRPVGYAVRLCMLFLEEIERDMYDKKLIDEIPTSELPDVVLSNQSAWFMRAALKFRVWFPKGSVANPSPAKYVAYYEICDNENKHPKEIRFIARNRVWWNQLTLEDAMREEELNHIIRDRQLTEEMSTWNTFNIVLTDAPIELARPLKLGKKAWAARLMPLNKIALPELINATTIDDLYGD